MLDSFPVGPPLPSINYFIKFILKKITTHPLIINPPIRHPLTNERVFIDRWRTYSGIEFGSGITCAIFPHSTPTDGLSLPKPGETSNSVLFEESDLGSDYDHAIYHVALKLHMNEYKLGNKEDDLDLITVPIDAAIHPSQQGFESNQTREIDIEINPGLMVISDFLELIRLAILDKAHPVNLPLIPRSIQVLYFNIKEGPWEKDKHIYFQEGEMLIRIDLKVSKGWRDKFNTGIQRLDININ
jgi:hypothetical protein